MPSHTPLLWGLIILLSTIYSGTSFGFETYRFVDESCNEQTGLIVNTDEDKIYLLTVDGSFKPVKRSKIKYILVYNTVNNPVESAKVDGPLRELLQDVYLTNMKTPNLVGWPIQFIEDLVVIFDLQGKINLIDQEKLLAIRPSKSKVAGTTNLKNFRKHTFSFGNSLPHCSKNVTISDVQPTRMISDKIKINEFLAGYEKGFKELIKFQRRTRFYARPFLFEKNTRLGFMVTNESYTQELPMDIIPLSIQWAGGRTYSHQSTNVVGYKTVEWLPNVEPVFAARSDLKSHFLSASVVGNLLALPAGKSFIDSNKGLFTSFYSNLDDDESSVVPQFNYMAITGVDYDRFSIALGVIYPIYGIYADGYNREVLATQSSLMTRFMFTDSNTRFRLIYSATQRSSSSPTEDDIRLALSSEMTGGSPPSLEDPLVDSLDNFSLNSSFIRTGVDYDLNEELRLGLDEVIIKTEYEETLFSTERSIKYMQYTTALYLKQQFGSFVSLQANANIFTRSFKNKFGNDDDNQDSTKLSGSMAIEFML